MSAEPSMFDREVRVLQDLQLHRITLDQARAEIWALHGLDPEQMCRELAEEGRL